MESGRSEAGRLVISVPITDRRSELINHSLGVPVGTLLDPDRLIRSSTPNRSPKPKKRAVVADGRTRLVKRPRSVNLFELSPGHHICGPRIELGIRELHCLVVESPAPRGAHQ
jgi:hypothetical protein